MVPLARNATDQRAEAKKLARRRFQKGSVFLRGWASYSAEFLSQTVARWLGCGGSHCTEFDTAFQKARSPHSGVFNWRKKRVYSLCLRTTENSVEAEELTQEVFLAVFRKRIEEHSSRSRATG